MMKKHLCCCFTHFKYKNLVKIKEASMINCLLFVALAVPSCFLFCFLSLCTLPCGPDGWTPSQSLALQLISPS